MHHFQTSPIRTLGVIGMIAVLTACGGGGGDDADTVAPTITSTTAAVSARSLATGLTHTVTVVASDNLAVTGGTVSVTKGGIAISGSPFSLSISGSTISARVGPLAPPLVGSDVYQYQATVTDAAGNRTSANGSFTIEGPTPPSTSGVPL